MAAMSSVQLSSLAMSPMASLGKPGSLVSPGPALHLSPQPSHLNKGSYRQRLQQHKLHVQAQAGKKEGQQGSVQEVQLPRAGWSSTFPNKKAQQAAFDMLTEPAIAESSISEEEIEADSESCPRAQAGSAFVVTLGMCCHW